MMIIAIVGLIGSGKTEATQRFIERGFFRVGFNDVVYEELARRGMERTEGDERQIRLGLRQEFGMAVMAERSIPKIERALSEDKHVVVESLYSWSEYKVVKDRFGDQFKVLAVYAPPVLRYERLAARPERPLDLQTAISRDYSEIESVEKAGPIAMADWTIQNTGARAEFFTQVDELVGQLLTGTDLT